MRTIIAAMILTLALPVASNAVKPDPVAPAPTDATKTRTAALRGADSNLETILRGQENALSSTPLTHDSKDAGDAHLEPLKRVIEWLRESSPRGRPEGALERPVWYRIGSRSSKVGEPSDVLS